MLQHELRFSLVFTQLASFYFLVVTEKGEQNARGEKNLEVLPPSITTEVHQHQSSITTTPPASEEQDKVDYHQSTTIKTTTPLVSEELTEAPVSSAAGSIQVFGYEGGDVNLSCPYDRGFEGRQKYLCNNNCRYADVLITTSQGSSGKYSIHDDKTTRVFTVTISALRLHDAGKYWCGVTRIGKDISIERKLEVKADRCCDTVNKSKVLRKVQ
ncbi:CMRF35-like molecule 5 [Poeciliopsis prolifica]|uniref:CMRF35-like molecule 5 n=1 Tax=Poeciliopsis prolifica TaxID=188132 RepID=UPI0024136BB3|nr:CMRF35-like molecule 5 [Poeciliopsis prolifica]